MNMERKRIYGISLVFFLLLLSVFFLFLFWKLLAPFILSYVFFYILKPFLNFFEQRGMSHVSSVCLVFFSLLGGFLIFLVFFIPALYGEILNIKDNIHFYTSSINAFFNSLNTTLSSLPFSSYILSQGNTVLSPSSDQVGAFVQSIAHKIPSLFSTFLLFIMVIPFATFFLLLDARRISHFLISLVPNRFFETTLSLFYNLDLQFNLILRGMIISVCIVSFLSSLGLWIINLKFPILIGIFSGISNLIPYAGPIVGIVAAFIAAIMTGAPQSVFISIIVVFLVVQFIDNVLIQPLVMSKSANLHPLLVLFLVLFGSSFGGVIGMLVIVPLISLSRVFLHIIFTDLNRPVRPAFSSFRDISRKK
jgi:predicted PurR-regulated permease PerM